MQAFSKSGKKLFQNPAAFLFTDTIGCLYLMVELLHRKQIQNSTGAACSRIHRSDHNLLDTRLHDRTRAHLAGL